MPAKDSAAQALIARRWDAVPKANTCEVCGAPCRVRYCSRPCLERAKARRRKQARRKPTTGP